MLAPLSRCHGPRLARPRQLTDARGGVLPASRIRATDPTKLDAAPAAADTGAPNPPPGTEPSPTSSVLSSTDSGTGPSGRRLKRKADSTDAVATFLTRRFGIAGGLAWLGILAVGSIGEQIKTRMEVANEASGAKDVADAPEVALPSGVRYKDLRVGGGSVPQRGFLVVLDFTLSVDGQQIDSTRSRGKPIVFVYGSRPLQGALCAGLEEALSSLRAGGRRVVTVPAEAGFGARGVVLRAGEGGAVPPGATLQYDVELVRVSIPPS